MLSKRCQVLSFSLFLLLLLSRGKCSIEEGSKIWILDWNAVISRRIQPWGCRNLFPSTAKPFQVLALPHTKCSISCLQIPGIEPVIGIKLGSHAAMVGHHHFQQKLSRETRGSLRFMPVVPGNWPMAPNLPQRLVVNLAYILRWWFKDHGLWCEHNTRISSFHLEVLIQAFFLTMHVTWSHAVGTIP